VIFNSISQHYPDWVNFAPKLMQWYDSNGRNLPWRLANNPYHIWVSEIILQQTRVNQGLPYYHNFLIAFPTVAHLANASKEELLKVWQGLGYYSRAINMHKAAKIIVNDYKGVFPLTFKQWLALPGVGNYTAAAISASALGIPIVAIDTNVKRFLSRLLAYDENVQGINSSLSLQQIADTLLADENPGRFNQALMDYGAMVCKATNPLCSSCVFTEKCFAYQRSAVGEFPAKTKAVVRKKRFFYFIQLCIYDNHSKMHFYAYQRTGNDIWKYLYELPLIETSEVVSMDELLSLSDWGQIRAFCKSADSCQMSKPVRHILTHQIIEARKISLVCNRFNLDEIPENWIKVDQETFAKLPIHRLIAKLMLVSDSS